MADNEPADELSASGTEPQRWPDPSRPIVSEQWGTGAHVHHGPTQASSGRPTPPPGGADRAWPPQAPLPAPRRRAWTVIAVVLIVLVAMLVSVWLLWWR